MAAFVPNGHYEAIDDNGVTVPEIGNGPEWARTEHGPEVTQPKKALGSWVPMQAIQTQNG